MYKIFTWENKKIIKYVILFSIIGSLCIISWTVFTGDFGGIFKPVIKESTTNEITNIHVPANNFLIIDELNKDASLDMVSSDHSSIFMDLSLENRKTFNTDIENFVFDNEYLNLIFVYSDKNNIQIVSPFSSTYHHSPSKLWSKAATHDPLHGPWHSYLKNRNIENWQSDYGKGLVFTWANDTLNISFNAEENNNYDIFIRYFKNKDGGEIRIYLDNELTQEIGTKDQLNKFVWEKIDTLNLEKGKHEITLENVNGFNAVNIFAIIPSSEYSEIEKEAREMIQDKRIIYIFESEYDLYYSNSTISDKYGSEASNGNVLELNPNSRAWQDVEIVRTGNYGVAANLNGKASFKIGSSTFKTFTTNLEWVNIGSVYLTEGMHRLEITSNKDTDLDVVWIYSTDGNETLYDIFTVNETAAQITSYEKVNPILWKVRVNATEPYMLSFAESYDPLWVSRIRENGATSEYQSIPFYSLINGFWIGKTGEYEIEITYKPQKWFNAGLVVSVTALACCIIYLIYDWKRDKIQSFLSRKYSKSIRMTPITSE